jgi:hypothetical protein
MIVDEPVDVRYEGGVREVDNHSQERRGRHRFNIAYAVTIRSSRGVIDGETKNMSGTGALIFCKKPLSPGETCDLTIWLPFDSPIETAARVVWSRLHDASGKTGLWEAGVQFL